MGVTLAENKVNTKIGIIVDYKPTMTIDKYVFEAPEDEFLSAIQIREKVVETLSLIPQSVIDLAVMQGYKVIITNKQNLETKYHIGYNVLSMIDYESKEIVAYASPLAISVIAHEFGHIIDNALGGISRKRGWFELCNKYKTNIENAVNNATKSWAYFTSTDYTEFFCDCFLTYIMNPVLLEDNFPDIRSVFKRIVKALDYIEIPNSQLTDTGNAMENNKGNNMDQSHIGILAPDGTFIPCEPYEHLDVALEIAEKISEKIFTSRLDTERYLLSLGYIELQGHGVHSSIGTFKGSGSSERIHLTREQKEWLEKNFGDFSDETRMEVNRIFEMDK